MLQYVSQSRDRARRAERDFEYQKRNIERKASRDIDLFGGTVTSQIAEIAADSRRACDGLYSAYQTEVRLLDDACRPLLEQKPSLEAVKAVYDLIKWLNSESEIENNFTASFNHRDLGQLATVTYVPSMDNKLIQRYWEAKYDSWPGRAEEIAAENERRRKAAEQARLREEKAKAEREEAERQKKAAEEQARIAVTRRIDAKKKELAARMETMTRDLAREKAQAQAAIDQDQSCLEALQAERERLGFFQFKEKKALAQEISALHQQIQNKKEKLERKQDAGRDAIDKLKEKIATISPAVKSEYLFGTQFHTPHQNMKWIVAGIQGNELLLLAKHTVGLTSFYASGKWMNETFLPRVFTAVEKRVLIPIERNGKTELVTHPSASEIRACCPHLGTTPEDGLLRSIRSEKTERGRQYHYNSLQIENSIKSATQDAEAYWLSTSSTDRSGFANYVGRAVGGGWIAARIGAGASFGVRPMICLNLDKLLDTL